MKKLEQSTCGYSSHDRCVHDASVSTLNDDVLIMKTIREITSRGNNAEVKRRSTGKLAVYEVRKSISIGYLDSMKG